MFQNPTMELQDFLRKNLSIIAITLFVILHQSWKLYSKPLKRRLSKLASKLSTPLHSYAKNTTGAPYTFIRTFGNSLLLLNSTPLIFKLHRNLDHFQDLSFATRTFNFIANLMRVSVDSKNFSKIHPILRYNVQNTKKQKHFNTNEYLIENKKKNVATPKEKTYLSELYPSLASTTNERADTEKNALPPSSSFLLSRSAKPVKFTSKTDHNDRLLLSEKYFAKNEHQQQRQTQCYSFTTNEQMPFSLMKETRSASDIQIMNMKNAAAAQQETSSASHLQLSEQSLPLIKYCVKEFCVLLEAKSNRKNVLDLKQFCYKHVLNVLGVCVFGHSVQMLTNSRSQFYDVCDDLNSLVGETEKGRVRRYVDGTLESLGLRERSLLKSKRIVDYFRGMVYECIQGTGDFSEHSLMSYLVTEANKTLSFNLTDGTIHDYAGKEKRRIFASMGLSFFFSALVSSPPFRSVIYLAAR